MDEFKLLEANPYKIANISSCVLTEEEQNKIKSVAHNHAKMILKLGIQQMNFAKSVKSKKAWRQKISRAYYACYNASKAIRLADNGHYSQEASDHKKISELPGSFNNKPFWEDFLKKFRSDRNIADYDHIKKSKDLEYSPNKYITESEKFIREAKNFLTSKGIL